MRCKVLTNLAAYNGTDPCYEKHATLLALTT